MCGEEWWKSIKNAYQNSNKLKIINASRKIGPKPIKMVNLIMENIECGRNDPWKQKPKIAAWEN